MTQEEKAKRYDEALDRAKYYQKENGSAVITAIFPELKESDDEKIRKALIRTFNEQRTNEHIKGVLVEDILAWLEKQGEQKQDPCEHCADKRLNCHNFPCVKGRAFKQGKSALEVIKEEPQVYDTEDGEIITYSETDGYKFYQPKFKDGDVLNSPSHHLIWIYKDNEHFYACVNMNYVTKNVATNGLISIPNDACHATKEQREQLEKAMADAGYSFDFDKKKLKKIEQKSAWSEEDERQWNNIFDVLDGHFELSKEGYKNAANWFKSLKDRYTWKPSEEQLEAVKRASNGSRTITGNDYLIMESLYQDLRKLK